ncbi:MAG: V-type ATP synthase subunit I [Ruminococcaceae bacterium]|nr:V-type ATP synthase subunit I [Oscillospiraceae bacterium]
MAIVKMKKLQLIALNEDRNGLMKKLQSLGCVEISSQELKVLEPDWKEYVTLCKADDSAVNWLEIISNALKVLDTYAPVKTPLFAPRPEYTEAALFDEQLLNAALGKAGEILELEAEIRNSASLESKAEGAKLSLIPWRNVDVPLDTDGTDSVAVKFGVCPSGINFDSLKKRLAEAVPESELYLSSTDREQHYMVLLVHRSMEDEAVNTLRTFGWSAAPLRGFEGTAEENILFVEKSLLEYAEKRRLSVERVSDFGVFRNDLKLAYERLYQDTLREQTTERLLATPKSFFLEGWVTVPMLDKVERVLSGYDCAYELTDPKEGDDVPVKLKSNRLTEPLNMVTEMYSLPAYDGVDPNPLIFPFFTMFFGLMYADIGYGIVLTVLSLVITKKFKPRGTIGQMMRLATLCGITTIFWGILFGSFFGDAVPVLCDLLNIEQVQLWSLIDPLEEPMVMLVASLALGVFHIICGMAINAVLLIKDGRAMDALFDVGSWWLLFAGIALGALGITWWVCIAGVAALILTQGRQKPTFVGKLIGGIASLYDITSYLGDILSYTRLMALLLASSVIASVVNVLGSLSGSIIVFIVVFLIGHAFNMGINIIGTYVHAARLQYLEFFGKFYKDGGRAFAPLTYKTKYTEIIKEEI